MSSSRSAGIAQLRATLARYVGVESTLQEIEADVVRTCRQIVDAAGAETETALRPTPIERAAPQRATQAEIDAAHRNISRCIPVDKDPPTPARKAWGSGTHAKPLPPPKPPRPKDTSAPPTTTAPAATLLAAVTARLDRPLTVAESSVVEMVADGFTLPEIADTLRCGYQTAWSRTQRLGLTPMRAPKGKKPAAAQETPSDD